MGLISSQYTLLNLQSSGKSSNPQFFESDIVSRECMFLGSLSHHNKDLERWTLKPSAHHSSRVLDKPCSALRQISVTALFYLEDSRRIQDLKRREWRSAWGGRERERVRERKRERESTRARGRESPRESALAPPFICFFFHRACPVQIGLSQECCLFCLKFSLWSLDRPSLSFNHCHFGLLFPILPT